jgi:hypothetical protein
MSETPDAMRREQPKLVNINLAQLQKTGSLSAQHFQLNVVNPSPRDYCWLQRHLLLRISYE